MWKAIAAGLALGVLTSGVSLHAADQASKEPAPPAKAGAQPAAAPEVTGLVPSRLYVLKPNDVVMVKVYQEEDLTIQARVARDGSITLPLLGTVYIGSNSVEQAIGLIRDGLAKDYLVNPQVSLSIVEYAKRRFTVLGQVTRPGTYEMPGDDSLNLLQAIAMAGGYTRIGAPTKITVQRVVADQTKIFRVNAESMAKNKGEKPFEILPEDAITVGEKWL
jgi:protein involved in polysaccharide export with SLBB domain